MNILLSCIGRRGYIAEYFRDALQSGDRIIGTSNSAWTAGFKACDLGVIPPDIQSPDYIPAFVRLCREQNIDAVFSLYDPDIHVLAKHSDVLKEAGITRVLPSAEVSAICFDKIQTNAFLEKHGLPRPLLFRTLDSALHAIKENITELPMMVKPRYGFGSVNLFKARTISELEAFYHYSPDMIIQTFLEGEEYGLAVCNDLTGNVLSVVPIHKFSMRAGEVDQAVSSNKAQLIKLGQSIGQLLGEYGHQGPLDIDVILHHGQACILDMNPRFGGIYPLAHLVGADFTGMLTRLLNGETVQPSKNDWPDDVVMLKTAEVYSTSRADLHEAVLDRRHVPNREG